METEVDEAVPVARPGGGPLGRYNPMISRRRPPPAPIRQERGLC
jgi:hypothetical protein